MENIKFENFIMIYENFLSNENCDYFIELFERAREFGLTGNRKQFENVPSITKNDEILFTSSLISEQQIDIRTIGKGYANLVDEFCKRAYNTYVDKYSIISAASDHKIDSIKIQKTEISGGYHVWHCEDNHHEEMDRLLTWILYLNDVEEGGETEFLYYPKRIKPKKGTLILWPAGFTHTHRGNPPISGTKYIITGWVNLVH